MQRGIDFGDARGIEAVAVEVQDEVVVADGVHDNYRSGCNAPRNLRTARKIACFEALTFIDMVCAISSIEWPSACRKTKAVRSITVMRPRWSSTWRPISSPSAC